MSHFETYGKLAKQDVDDTCQNGRYAIQKDAEANIPADIISKLAIKPTDSFLDIGCGLGLNLKPIAGMVAEAVGCDHENVIEKAKERVDNPSVEFIGGNFLEIGFDKKFDKVLAYSVLPALPDEDVVYAFVEKALGVLKPEGRMLFGDLSNTDKKARFLASKRGERFKEEWDKNYANQSDDENLSSFSDAGPAVNITDKTVMDLVGFIRSKGFHAYVMDQPQNLPFGNSREDILVIGPEYEEGK